MAQRTWLITGVSSGFGRHIESADTNPAPLRLILWRKLANLVATQPTALYEIEELKTKPLDREEAYH